MAFSSRSLHEISWLALHPIQGTGDGHSHRLESFLTVVLSKVKPRIDTEADRNNHQDDEMLQSNGRKLDVQEFLYARKKK